MGLLVYWATAGLPFIKNFLGIYPQTLPNFVEAPSSGEENPFLLSEPEDAGVVPPPDDEPKVEEPVVVVEPPAEEPPPEDNSGPPAPAPDQCSEFYGLNLVFEIWDNDSCTTSYQFAYRFPFNVLDTYFSSYVDGEASVCNVNNFEADLVVCTINLPASWSESGRDYELFAEGCEEPVHQVRSYVPLIGDCGDPEPGVTPSECPSPESCAAMGCSYEVNASEDVCDYSCVCP
jgi:hypothetical protein